MVRDELVRVSIAESLKVPEGPRSLSIGDARIHLNLLQRYLSYFSKGVDQFDSQNLPDPMLHQFVEELISGLDLLLKQKEYEASGVNSDVQLPCKIKPESGYPLFNLDIALLRRRKAEAGELVKTLPNEEQLVEDAQFTIFRGVVPTDVIEAYRNRARIVALTEGKIPAELTLHQPSVTMEQRYTLSMKQVITRLDDVANIPRMYVLNFEVPSRSLHSLPWQEDMAEHIRQGLVTLPECELANLAGYIESTEGVNLLMITRYDIGPFHTRFTSNPEPLDALLQAQPPDAAVLSSETQTVFRMQEIHKTGFKAWWQQVRYGITTKGVFSPTISRGVHLIMPHTLVQAAVASSTTVYPNASLHGIISKGDIL